MCNGLTDASGKGVLGCYLLARAARTQAEAEFLDLLGSGFLSPVDLTPEDYQRAAQLVRRYADLPLGGVDTSLVAVAERLGIAELVTLDMRHFTVVRPNHVEAFRRREGSAARDADRAVP